MCPIAKAIGGYVLEADPLAFRLILVDSLNTAAA
jgi:hypothetical protein